MIDLSSNYLGLSLKNPLVASSSPLTDNFDDVRRLEDAGVAAIVLPSLFEESISREQQQLEKFVHSQSLGHYEAESYRPVPDDYKSELENYLQHLQSLKSSLSIPVIASLNGVSDSGWIDYGKELMQAGADALELNVYYVAGDPEKSGEQVENRYLDLLNSLRGQVNIPVTMKLSSQFSSVANMVKKLQVGGADGVVLFNRFYQPDIDLESLKILPHLELSNPQEALLRIRWIALIRSRVELSLAATGGFHRVEEIVKALLVGADAIYLCSVLLAKGPEYCATLLQQLDHWLTEHEYESVKQMQGSVSQACVVDPAVYEHSNYIDVIKSFKRTKKMTHITDLVSAYVHEAQVSAIKDMAMRSAKIPDAVSLTWGLPSFQTPEYIRQGVKNFLDNNVDAGKYTLPDGLIELRELVATTHFKKTGIQVDANKHVMIGAGNMQGLNTLFHTILDPGDEIILTDPCFASHIQQIIMFNGVPVYWPLEEENGWQLDLDKLPELITEKTQAIVLVSPSNPTGKIFTKEDLIKVGKIAKAHNILVIIDDPYSEFLYENSEEYFNLASVADLKEHIVYLYSFSKSYAMSGWRLCYMVMPEELKAEALKVHDATMICAPRISQLAGIVALSGESNHKEIYSTALSTRRDLIQARLDNVSHVFDYQKPQGAYYIFPKIITEHTSSKAFAIDLLNNAKVAVTPGSAFGPSGEHHVRMAYCVDEDAINLAFDRMEKYFPR